jgi:hypothetical protein
MIKKITLYMWAVWQLWQVAYSDFLMLVINHSLSPRLVLFQNRVTSPPPYVMTTHLPHMYSNYLF